MPLLFSIFLRFWIETKLKIIFFPNYTKVHFDSKLLLLKSPHSIFVLLNTVIGHHHQLRRPQTIAHVIEHSHNHFFFVKGFQDVKLYFIVLHAFRVKNWRLKVSEIEKRGRKSNRQLCLKPNQLKLNSISLGWYWFKGIFSNNDVLARSQAIVTHFGIWTQHNTAATKWWTQFTYIIWRAP